jgi:hypothetical protein
MDSPMNVAKAADPGPHERISEIGALFAGALTRLQSRKSSAFVGACGESSLHISPEQSVDAAAVLDGEVA